MTWDEMCALEPGLEELERRAMSLGADGTYQNYECMKKDMRLFVGWHAENRLLSSAAAWDIAHEHIAMRCAP